MVNGQRRVRQNLTQKAEYCIPSTWHSGKGKPLEKGHGSVWPTAGPMG